MELLPPEIVEALDRGATIVTGNRRAARTLRRAFDRHNKKLGLASWQPADVIAWDDWTARLWQRLLLDGHASRMLMNRTQEHTIWRRVLAGDSGLRSLQSKDSLAEMAADAWRRLCSYKGQGRLHSLAVSSDTRAFQQWAIKFQRMCRDENLLSQAGLADALSSAAKSGQVRVETIEVVLVGFDQMTPAQMDMVGAIRSSGCKVTELRLTMPGEKPLLVSVADELEEIYAAARWARRFIEGQPGARGAVVVPDLEKHRAEIDRVFREVLAPELQSIAAPGNAVPYEFSLGVALARTPLVIAALDLLRWAKGPLPMNQASALLLSPYFAMEPGEHGIRAEFDAFELRKAKLLRPEISLHSLTDAVNRSQRRHRLGQLPGTLWTMRLVAARRLEGLDRRTHAEWAERMQELLKAARWGAPAETSIEFQIRNKWESALDELATLDFDGSRVEFGQALESLQRIAQQTMFAPESRDAPVQVMGPLEAAGTTFDAVWFLRGGDLTWPLAATCSPLLPWQLQRDLDMPGTDVTRDSEHARKTTERIAASAGTAIFSYARESAEGTQRPSPALAGLGLEEADVLTIAGVEPHRSIIRLQTIEDTARVRAPEDRAIRGGARVLKLQAACGFRAFAEQRLWSSDLERGELGMDARQSGTAVHHVLELFWNEVKTQQALKSMPPTERTALLDRCIAQGLEKAATMDDAHWSPAYMQMQQERLRRVLGPWLELEMERPPFAVKLSEKDFDDVRVGPLRLRVRMDRVDLVDGGELLIDYKTGAASPSAWLTERPDEPQLPLYAMLSDPKQLQGIAFGLVRAGDDLKLDGYAATQQHYPPRMKMKIVDLEAQVEDWRRVLVNLATGFHAGIANVDPKKYPATCEHCAQRIFCRLDPSQLEEDENESATEADRG